MGGEVWWWCEKLDVESSYDPIIQLLSIFPEELKTGNSSKYIHKCVTQQLYSQRPKGGNHPIVQQQPSGHYRRSADPRGDMDERHTHDADRSQTQRSAGCTSPLIETARTGKTTERSVAVAESWGAVGAEEE